MYKLPQKFKTWAAIVLVVLIYFLTACLVFKEQIDERANMEICPLCNMEVYK